MDNIGIHLNETDGAMKSEIFDQKDNILHLAEDFPPCNISNKNTEFIFFASPGCSLTLDCSIVNKLSLFNDAPDDCEIQEML